MNPTNLSIPQAYRHLYRAGLRAIRHSTPARHTFLARLRRGFRKSLPQDFDPARVLNTVQFLENAATPPISMQRRTLEHRVLRSLLHTWYWQDLHTKYPEKGRRMRNKEGTEAGKEELKIRSKAFDGFDHMVKMLNESMGMCIR